MRKGISDKIDYVKFLCPTLLKLQGKLGKVRGWLEKLANSFCFHNFLTGADYA